MVSNHIDENTRKRTGDGSYVDFTKQIPKTALGLKTIIEWKWLIEEGCHTGFQYKKEKL